MTKPVALITGASRGLGAELSKIFSLTHHIIAVARTIGALEALDDEIKSKGFLYLAPIDLTDEKATAQLCRSIFDRWGTLKIWAHTAIHAAPLGPVMTIDSSDWNKSVKNNVTALAHFIPMVTPLLGDDSEVIFFEDKTIMKNFLRFMEQLKLLKFILQKPGKMKLNQLGHGFIFFNPTQCLPH